MSTGICPMCYGSGRKLTDGRTWGEYFSNQDIDYQSINVEMKYHLNDSDTKPCTNCGGYEHIRPNGMVPLRDDGTPCMHEFEMISMTPTAEIHKCKHCKYQYRVGT